MGRSPSYNSLIGLSGMRVVCVEEALGDPDGLHFGEIDEGTALDRRAPEVAVDEKLRF